MRSTCTQHKHVAMVNTSGCIRGGAQKLVRLPQIFDIWSDDDRSYCIPEPPGYIPPPEIHIADGTPFGILAEWFKARRRGHRVDATDLCCLREISREIYGKAKDDFLANTSSKFRCHGTLSMLMFVNKRVLRVNCDDDVWCRQFSWYVRGIVFVQKHEKFPSLRYLWCHVVGRASKL